MATGLKRLRVALAAVAIGVGAVVLGASSTSATNFIGDSYVIPCDRSPDNEPCLADSRTHNVFKNVGPNYLAAINSTLYGSWDTTNINVTEASGAHGSTDVYYWYDTLPGTLVGQTNCISLSSDPTRCDHFHVSLDQEEAIRRGWGDGTANDQDRLKAIACHETGHTLGLYHTSSGPATYRCMYDNPPVAPSTVGDHNAAHMEFYLT